MKNQDNVIIGIYKITNPNNEVYIGQSINIENRRNRYSKLICKRQPKIYESIIKYGWEAHNFEIIKECLKEDLSNLEEYYKNEYIKKFGWDKSLFYRIKDGKGGECSEETKHKISQANKGKLKGVKKTENTRLKMILYSKNRTLEHKNNISKSLKNIKKSPEHCIKKSKPIIQLDLQNNIIRRWFGIKEACTNLKIDRGTLCSCLKGRQKTCGGYKWEYDSLTNLKSI